MNLYNKRFIITEGFGKYIEAKGWFLSLDMPGLAKVWHSNTHSNYEILQPLSMELKDFSNRLDDLVKVISITENKSLTDVVKEIENASSDVISLRVIHDDVANGEIPFFDGILLLNKTKELIVSAARSVVKPQKAKYTGKSPEIVENFLSSLKLGQTEVGSYVLNLIAPIYFVENQQADHCIVPFSRTVSARLLESVTSLSHAIDRFEKNRDFKEFEKIISNGVNATLCSAIIGLSGNNRNRSVEISVQPSPFSSSEISSTTKLLITADKMKYIEDAERFFSNDYVISNYALKGFVTKLNRDINSIGGEITLTEPSEKNRKVTVELDEEHYLQAIKAHELKNDDVYLVGKLVVTPRKARLINVAEFEILKHSIR